MPSPLLTARTLYGRYQAARDRSRMVRWGVDLALVLAILAGIAAYQTRGHLHDVAAPPFALATLDGKHVALSDLKGRPALLAFWAPWCVVCKTESQNLSWVKELVGSRASVISIAAAYQNPMQVQQYAQQNGVDYPVLLGNDELVEAFRVSAYPTVYFLDAQGRVTGSVVGYTSTVGLLWRLFL